MNITDGKRQGFSDHALVMFTFPYDSMRRTYDRLRKRSYRRLNMDIDAPVGEWWEQADHEAYVAGVRDALNNLRGYRSV